MPTLRELQRGVAAALAQGRNEPAATWVIGHGLGGVRRLKVYRNDYLEGFSDALRAIFPVVERLVGAEFFNAMARRYIPGHPSHSGNLHDYGRDLPEFIADFEPAAALVYLADVARLEWAYHHAFHAADHPPLDAAALARVADAQQEGLRLLLHPSCTLLHSRWPIVRIWQVNQPGLDGDPAVSLDDGGDSVLVARRGLEIDFERLAPGDTALLETLAAGRSLGAAADAALAAAPDFDLGARLHWHIQRHTLVGFELPAGNPDRGMDR